jgi:phosphoribosylanthranilate isomerase
MILKICGITNAEDAAAAIDAGANAIGFNFYEPSPRYLAPERAAGIPTASGVRRVGVFVNEAPARIEEIARIAALDVAQLHGDETSGEYPATVPVWKAARVGPGFDFAQAQARYDLIPVEALLLDGPASGVALNWHVAATMFRVLLHRPHRIILAGGLDASNVAEAVALVHPWGVDACSRIESAPGKKDHRKMTEFLQAAKAALGA